MQKRCETCKHFDASHEEETYGFCPIMTNEVKPQFYAGTASGPEVYDWVQIPRTFGCVLYEEKEQAKNNPENPFAKSFQSVPEQSEVPHISSLEPRIQRIYDLDVLRHIRRHPTDTEDPQ